MRLAPPVLALPLLAGLLLAAPARATTVLSVPVEELTRTAAAVVRGVVEKRDVARSADGLNIETRTTIRVAAVLKGDAPASVVVNQLGGELDGIGQKVPGDAAFRVGEEVVVFLQPHPGAKGEYVLSAMAAAKFTVKTTTSAPIAIRDLGGLTFARKDADGTIRVVPGTPVTSLPLTELLGKIATGAK